MPETNLGIKYPGAGDLIKSSSDPSELAKDFMELASSTNIAMLLLKGDVQGVEDAFNLLRSQVMTFKDVGQLPPNKADWIGLEKSGMYRLPNQAATDAIVDRPLGSGPALVNIYPMGTRGSLVVWREYSGKMREWKRSVSQSASNSTDWILQTPTTRRVLHQLSMPGNANLRDAETTRHVRVPVKLPAGVGRWDLTFKNFNEQTNANFGDLDFADVYIGKAQVGTNGQLTAQFDGPPTNLGKPSVSGSGPTSRYTITGISFAFEPNTEYLLSYGYTKLTSTDAHMGIGGSWLGTDPSMTGRYDPPVPNSWSPNIPLDVYLTLQAPAEVPAYAYLGSSSETGLGSNHPLRDVWGWKHAEANGALPVLLGHSGSTIQAWSSASRYVWAKLASTFDKVDATYMAAGSNDVYLGRTLAQMKTDATALAQLIRLHLSTSIINVNVFPRRTESAAIRAVRKAWNGYLNTMPDGASGALDRVRAVSTDAELMRPELDSGDGTHLTTQGQTFLAAAAVAFAVLQPNLNRYTVSEEAGRRITVWDYLNSREQMIYGDTGERDISSLIPGRVSGGLRIYRENNRVTLIIDDLIVAEQGTTWVSWSSLIPSGFRHSGTGYLYLPLAPNTTIDSSGGARTDRFGNFFIYNMSGGKRARGIVSWRTADPWPTIQPGTAVGTIPHQ